MRHLEVKDLWLQSEVKQKKVELFKVKSEHNPADLFTKKFNLSSRFQYLLKINGLEVIPTTSESSSGA